MISTDTRTTTKPAGGSELIYNSLIQHVGSAWSSKVNLILSACDPALVDPNKINVLWQHLNVDQDNVILMADKDFVNSIDYFVYVSHWQYEQFRRAFNVPEHKSFVIKNATDAFDYVPKIKTDKIKLLYTSTPWRGLDVLLAAIDILNRDDIELDVYSSTIIYGSNFYASTNDQYKQLFDQAKSMNNVNYMGYSTNAGIRKAVQSTNILSYPCVFEETSCISVIEAASAGCQIVTTNYGALYETAAEWATYVPYNSDRNQLAIDYASTLNHCIDNFWSDQNQSQLKMQTAYYNKFWSWATRSTEWREFFDRISK